MPFAEQDFSTHTVSGEIVNLPYPDNGRYYYVIKTSEIDSQKVSTKIRLSSHEKLDAEPFDAVSGEMKLFKLGGFSDEMTEYYHSKDMYIGAYADNAENISVSKQSGFHPMRFILKLRASVINAIERNLPDEYGGLLTGFLLGEKSFISQRTLNAFSLIGSFHLLAVSGLHVSVWAAFVLEFLKMLGINRRLRSFMMILFVLVFEAVTGFNPPVVRAGTMIVFVFLGELGKRQADSLNSIGFAVTVMLFINPFAANSGSLWLSCFASVGIILLARPIYEKLNFRAFKSKGIEKVRTAVLESFSVTTAVTVFTLPLTVILFDRFSIITPVSNLALIGLASFAMIVTGVAALLFLTGLKFVAFPLFLVASAAARIITDFSVLLSEADGITLSTRYLPLKIIAFVLPAAAVICLLLKSRRPRISLKPLICFAVIAFFAVTACGIIHEKTSARVYLAGSDGGMSVIVCEKNSVCVLGCGSNDFSSYKICDIMKKDGARSADFVYVPTSDVKMRSALAYIENGYPVDKLIIDESGKAELENGARLVYCSDYAVYDSGRIRVLVLFDGDADTGGLSADFTVTPDGIILQDGPVQAEQNETLLLEVKQNGRARVKSSD
jgi:competence protein ComEC